ncbi:MAG TPA: O-antigen ligase family protein [Bryobacteraceae bacterium]|nr:O-antigen ligase family protein [Bryobacteraceae bacterium]
MDFVGLIVYCILVYLRPGDWVDAVRGWPLEFVTLALTVCAVLLKLFLFSDAETRRERLPVASFMLAWIAAIFLSNLVHGDSGAGIDNAVVYAKRCIVCLAYWAVLTSTNKIRVLVFFLVPLAGLLGLQGMYQVAHGVGWAGQPLYWAGRICWIGLWDGANVLSLLFVSTVPFVLEIVTGKWNIFAKIVAAVSGALILEGMILAASRGGWLSLGVIVLLYFRQKVGKLGLIIGGLCVLGLIAIGPSRLSQNADADADDASSRHRVDLWSEGLEMFKGSPVLGVGKGQFAEYTGTQVAHNAFIENLGETGFLGVFSWVGLIYLSFKSLRLVMRRSDELSPQLKGLTQAVFVSLVGYLSASMFINTDFDLLYMSMGLCAALLAVARRELKGGIEVHFGFADMRNIALFATGGIFYMYAVTAALS